MSRRDIWWRNPATDPSTPGSHDPRVPPSARLAARAFAAGALGVGLLFFVVPVVAIDIWPWQLTPLTARVLSSLTVQVGVGALVLSLDSRCEHVAADRAHLLRGHGAAPDRSDPRFGDFDFGNPLTWIYLGGLLATAGALVLLHRRMEAPIGDEHPPSTPAPHHVGA